MEFINSCCGLRPRKDQPDPEREPLLTQVGDDDTARQAALREKLRTLNVARALYRGYLPSNDQIIANIRSLMASDMFTAAVSPNSGLSRDGRRLGVLARQWLQQLTVLLEHHNADDAAQEAVWHLSRVRVSVDTEDLAERAAAARGKADLAAAGEALQAVVSLLLTNSDFRLFLDDLTALVRSVAADSAFAVSGASEEVGERLKQGGGVAIEAPNGERAKGKEPAVNSDGPSSSKNGIAAADGLQEAAKQQTTEVAGILAEAGEQVAQQTTASITEKLRGDEGDALLARLHRAVLSLSKREDYTQAAPVLTRLIRRATTVYTRGLGEAATAVAEDVEANRELDKATDALWRLARSFGEAKDWDTLERSLVRLMEHRGADTNLESVVNELANALEQLLMDPDFFDHAKEKMNSLRAKLSETTEEGSAKDRLASLRNDIGTLLTDLQTCIAGILNDPDVAALTSTTSQIASLLAPPNSYATTGLVPDTLSFILPRFLSALHHVPIPRLEVQTPDLDLLLEPLVLEPGHGARPDSSFLPTRLKASTFSEVDVHVNHPRHSPLTVVEAENPQVPPALPTASASASTIAHLEIRGLGIAAHDVGFIMRLHGGRFPLVFGMTATGVASIDISGLDIGIEASLRRDRVDEVVELRQAKVRVRELDYKLDAREGIRGMGILAAMVKPLLRPLLRQILQRELTTAVVDAMKTANREIVYARERLRGAQAARAAGEGEGVIRDYIGITKALAARWTPPSGGRAAEEGAARVRVVWDAGMPDDELNGRQAKWSKRTRNRRRDRSFEGIYAPGSLVKVWSQEERALAEAGTARGWRSVAFDPFGPV